MAKRNALRKAIACFGGRQEQEIRKAMDEIRNRFIIGIDAADGFSIFVLEGSERSPFVNEQIGLGRKSMCEAGANDSNDCSKYANGFVDSHKDDRFPGYD